MTRYKGKQVAQAIERGFPHSVEILIPLGGLGKTLDDMYEFHTQYRIRAHTRSRRDRGGRDYIRWCFADRAVARSFVTVFAESN
jgi:hypothetical protein